MAKWGAKGAAISIDSVTIPQVRDIGESSGGETERIDTTTHDSPDGRRESVAGFKGEASIVVTIALDTNLAAHQGLIALHTSGEVVPVIITLPTTPASTVTFDAYVVSFPVPALPLDQAILVPVTLGITGAIEFPDPTP